VLGAGEKTNRAVADRAQTEEKDGEKRISLAEPVDGEILKLNGRLLSIYSE
jgi:hypothetical protein